METVFCNDPFCILDNIFRELWPEKEYRAKWVASIKDENGVDICGVTEFVPEYVPVISVSGKLDILDAIEIFAHELAHVAVYAPEPERLRAGSGSATLGTEGSASAGRASVGNGATATGIESEHGAEWEAAFELLHARYMERVAHE